MHTYFVDTIYVVSNDHYSYKEMSCMSKIPVNSSSISHYLFLFCARLHVMNHCDVYQFIMIGK